MTLAWFVFDRDRDGSAPTLGWIRCRGDEHPNRTGDYDSETVIELPPEIEPVPPQNELPDLGLLRAEMIAAHPDNGGSSADFITARDREHTLAPFDDPLPGQPLNAFLILRERHTNNVHETVKGGEKYAEPVGRNSPPLQRTTNQVPAAA